MVHFIRECEKRNFYRRFEFIGDRLRDLSSRISSIDRAHLEHYNKMNQRAKAVDGKTKELEARFAILRDSLEDLRGEFEAYKERSTPPDIVAVLATIGASNIFSSFLERHIECACKQDETSKDNTLIIKHTDKGVYIECP